MSLRGDRSARIDGRGVVAMRVLFVCDANRARSPLAAALFARELDRRGMAAGVGVASAGLATRDGQPAVPEAVEAAQTRGLDLAAHRSHLLTEEDLDAELVITMTRSQLDVIAPRRPGLATRAFTLIELVSLLALADLRGNQRRDEEREELEAAVGPVSLDDLPDELDALVAERRARRRRVNGDAWEQPATLSEEAAANGNGNGNGNGGPSGDAGSAAASPTASRHFARAVATAIAMGVDVANAQRPRRLSALREETPRGPSADDVIDPMAPDGSGDPNGLRLRERMDATALELERLIERLARLLVGPAPQAPTGAGALTSE